METGVSELSRVLPADSGGGRLDGISVVGLDLGELLHYAGQEEQASEILTRSRDGFLQLGWSGMAQRAEILLQECAKNALQGD